MQSAADQPDFFSPGVANNQKAFLAASRLQAQAFKAIMRYQIETLSFLKHRYEQDVKLVDDLVASDEFSDVFDVFSSFVQNATSEYAREAGKVASIGSRLATEAANRVRKQAEDTIGDMAAKTIA